MGGLWESACQSAFPWARRGGSPLGGGKSKPIEKKEGTLVLDFLDAKTKSLVWHATASGAVRPTASPEEQQQRINEVITQLLARFPPKN